MSGGAAPAGLVHVVEDEASIRRALERVLTAGGYAARLHDSAESFLAAHDPEAPACAGVDMHLPGLDGCALQAAVAASPLPVIFLTGRGDISMSVRAMKGGAFDFLTKPVEAETLLGAVGRALDEAAEARAGLSGQARFESRLRRLTPREREVHDAVVAGEPNKRIAYDLGLAEKTVKVHRARVMTKMGARSLADLVRAAVTRRIEEP